jgi:hypothetical protein
MTPTDSVRANKVPLFRQVYGVRREDGTINGQLYTRSIISDGMKAIIIFLLLAIIGAGIAVYKWYIENKDMPQAFKIHCEKQIETERALAGTLGRIEEGIEDLREQRRRRRDDR